MDIRDKIEATSSSACSTSDSNSSEEVKREEKTKRKVTAEPEDKIGATSPSSDSVCEDKDFVMQPIKRRKISDDANDATDNFEATSLSTSAPCGSDFMNEIQNILSAGLAKMLIMDDPENTIGATSLNPTDSDSDSTLQGPIRSFQRVHYGI